MKDKIILIQRSELCTIGALLNADILCGYSFDADEVDKKEVIGILHSLWKRGILERENDSVKVSADYKEFFESIFAANYLMEITSNEKSVCGYIGKGIVWVEPSEIKEGELLITAGKGEKVVSYLDESEFLPIIKERDYEFDEEPGYGCLKGDSILEIKLIKMSDGERQESIKIVQDGLKYIIIEETADKRTNLCNYSQKQLGIIIKKLLKKYRAVKAG